MFLRTSLTSAGGRFLRDKLGSNKPTMLNLVYLSLLLQDRQNRTPGLSGGRGRTQRGNIHFMASWTQSDQSSPSAKTQEQWKLDSALRRRPSAFFTTIWSN